MCGVCRTCVKIPNADALGLPPAPVPILSLGLGRGNTPLARFAQEAFPNAGLVDVGNYHAARMDGRGVDDPKIRDAIRVEALIGAGKKKCYYSVYYLQFNLN